MLKMHSANAKTKANKPAANEPGICNWEFDESPRVAKAIAIPPDDADARNRSRSRAASRDWSDHLSFMSMGTPLE